MGHWLDKRIIFFGGKGGVGKTTLASAHALKASNLGKKVLLVSTDPAHNTGDIFGMEIGRSVKEINPHLWALEIDPHHESHRYIEKVKDNLKQVVSGALLEEVYRQVDIAHVSPGAEEAALFDRIVDIILHSDQSYDMVIFDTAPTGHTIRLLSLPELMGVWIDGMLQRRQKTNELKHAWMNDGEPVEDPIYSILNVRKAKFAKAREVLMDETKTGFMFVLIPEKLPIVETDKAIQLLTRYQIPIHTLYVNRLLPEDVEGTFLINRKKQEGIYMEEIRARFGDRKQVHVPMLDQDVEGMDTLRKISESIQA